jgi:GDP-4-dehydro-6-deoxy-D-mannose reductase
MRLLVTGADGFVGRYLVREARAEGHQVVAAVISSSRVPEEWGPGNGLPPVEVVQADFREEAEVRRLAAVPCDAVVHLAAIASGAASRVDPQGAMLINAIATVWLVSELAEAAHRPRFLFVSTAEVYGPGHSGPISEAAPMNPTSPYAASKAAAEPAIEDLSGHGKDLPFIIARPFPHSGAGQSTAFVLPALAARLRAAKQSGEQAVRTGNLAAVRDFLDVRDVVRAYLLLLEKGVPGEVYNVASGVGRRLTDCFTELARLTGITAHPVEDAALLRPGDIPVLIGDATKLRDTTGWSPQIPFERTLQDLVDAQAD